MQNNQSVLYVNFAQYDNAGRILDYLVTNFTIVAHFSFDHLRLKSGRKTNFLKVYNHGKLIEEVTLRNIRLKPLLQFPTLPIVAFMMVYQTLFHAWRLSRHFGPFSYFFTVNAFSALIGISTKLLGFSQKTVYWVWDFFPLTFPDWRIRLIRKIYWQWDKLALRFSDHVVFTNKRLQTMILKTRHVGHSQKYSIVPVGTRVYAARKIRPTQKITVGFLGMLKTNQGLDLIIDSAPLLKQKFPGVRIDIIGSGPEEEFFLEKTKPYNDMIRFYGFIKNDDDVMRIVRRWAIGLAPYVLGASNESYWGDPSKIKTYLGAGIPVITTNVSYFTSEIIQNRAGIVIPYTTNDLVRAVRTILKDPTGYAFRAHALGKAYAYEKLYPNLFLF